MLRNPSLGSCVAHKDPFAVPLDNIDRRSCKYKAAYYSGSPTGADGDGYWLYPTQSNSITTDDANYNNSVGTVTDVGTYAGDASHYGTFDQGGNEWEWNDAIVNTIDRRLRGSSFSNSGYSLQSSYHTNDDPTFADVYNGFRVSSLAPIPEPSTYAAIVGGLGLLIALMRRKRTFLFRTPSNSRRFSKLLT